MLWKELIRRKDGISAVFSGILAMVIVVSSVGVVMVTGVPYINKLNETKENENAKAQFASAIESIEDVINSNDKDIVYFNPGQGGSVNVDSEKDRTILWYSRDPAWTLSVSNLAEDVNNLNVHFDDSARNIDSAKIYWFDWGETCFLSGTQVLMSDGSYRPIEDVNDGEEVFSFNEESGRIEPSMVTKKITHEPEEMTGGYILLNRLLGVTPNHMFYSRGSWVSASDLIVGTRLFCFDGSETPVNDVRNFPAAREYSYDLEIEPLQNYFVNIEDRIDVLVQSSESTPVPPVPGDNTPPKAADDIKSTNEDTEILIDVLANDFDEDDHDTINITRIFSGPSYGTASVVEIPVDEGKPSGGGGDTRRSTVYDMISYRPNLNWYGTDSFEYEIEDGEGGTDTAKVTVTVISLNDPPKANNDYVTLIEDTGPIEINVLANDNDAEGDPFWIFNYQYDDVNGYLEFDGTHFFYTPNPNFYGSDYFYYWLTDAENKTGPATVYITVVGDNEWAPTLQLSAPAEGSIVNTLNPTLSVLILDQDGGSALLNVTFYDASNNSILGTASVIAGGIASIVWHNLRYNTNYHWKVTVNDTNFNHYYYVNSAQWNFTTKMRDETHEEYFGISAMANATVTQSTSNTWIITIPPTVPGDEHPMVYSGTVSIDLYSNNFGAVGIPFATIWIFDSSSLTFEAASSGGASNIVLENGGVIQSLDGHIYVDKNPMIYENNNMLVLSVKQIYVTSNSYMGASGDCTYKLNIDYKGSVIGREQSKTTDQIYGLGLEFFGDHSNQWYEYYDGQAFSFDRIDQGTFEFLKYSRGSPDSPVYFILGHSFINLYIGS